MVKNIIVLSDGTGNAAAKVWRTNVWRVFEALDLSRPDQIAHYDDGVGTSSFKLLALLGGMFGYGLKHNVIDCYKFVCRSYQPGDRIYGFGFSRGAYTIRVVGKLILTQGLAEYDGKESTLHRNAIAAYRAFRKQNGRTVSRIEVPLRAIRDFILRTSYNFQRVEVPEIHFLGLWDTVAAYGLPFEGMTTFYSKWIFPFEILDEKLHDGVRRARHALSMDDERTTFHPVLWSDAKEPTVAGNSPTTKHTQDERISQVWFAGSHSNVGGGYPDDSLAQVPLTWIMAEADKRDLHFKRPPAAEPDAQLLAKSCADKNGRMYDSRQGVASYYRYGPRDIQELCNGPDGAEGQQGVLISHPKIHQAVFERINNATHPYAPIGLPPSYLVVKDNGEIASLDQAGYETSEQATRRFKHQEKVWDFVWCKRLAYYGIVLSSLFLVLFPIVLRSSTTDESSSRLHPISDLIRLATAWVPTDQFDFWINGYAESPLLFVIGIAVLGFFLWLSRGLSATISDTMTFLWNTSFEKKLGPKSETTWQTKLRTNPAYIWLRQRIIAAAIPAGCAVLFIYYITTVSSHLLFNFTDAFGLVCTASNPQPGALEGKTTVTFKSTELCQKTGVFLKKGEKYLIQFDTTKEFADGLTDASKGFTTLQIPDRSERLFKALALPLRRNWLRPWFRLVARIGSTGGDETFLDPDIKDQYWIDEIIRSDRDGELFLYVNDAALPFLPGLSQRLFYDRHHGTAKVTIEHR